MVTRQQLNELQDRAEPGHAMATGMACALVLAMIDADKPYAEAIRAVLWAAGYQTIEIDRHGNDAFARFFNIVAEHGPLEDDHAEV